MRQSNILIIDDNHDLTDGLCMVLEDEGYQVKYAYNGNDGVEEFFTGNFDVVFLDVKLPDISGIEVFWKIHRKDPDAKIIMMTGFRIEQTLMEVVDDGDVEILRKPYENRRVLEILKQSKKESLIFIADENPDAAENISGYLAEHGMKSISARKPQDAIDGVLSSPVDVLVLDMRRSVMCSLEVYLEIKQQGQTVKTVIVAGYEKDEVETADILRSISVTGCLFKPFRPEQMLKAIEQARKH